MNCWVKCKCTKTASELLISLLAKRGTKDVLQGCQLTYHRERNDLGLHISQMIFDPKTMIFCMQRQYCSTNRVAKHYNNEYISYVILIRFYDIRFQIYSQHHFTAHTYCPGVPCLLIPFAFFTKKRYMPNFFIESYGDEIRNRSF